MKRTLAILLAIFTLTMLILPASADNGPKPSLNIVVEGYGDRLCYATVLSKSSSSGPQSAWNGDEEDIRLGNVDGGMDIWLAFENYVDADGFQFLQIAWELKSGEINYRYLPPKTFKLLLYFPDTGEYLVSGIHERYAFHSWFDAKIDGSTLTLTQNYPIAFEVVTFLVRLVITLLIELLIAMLFGLSKQKRVFPLLLIVNGATQILLNVLLILIVRFEGEMMFVLGYIGLELLVTAIEAIVYAIYFPKLSGGEVKKSTAISYALLANLFSFIGGMAISSILPDIY